MGFQLLFEGSEEKGEHEGLGIFPGRFKEFEKGQGLSVPHMGWNSLEMQDDPGNLCSSSSENDVYFVHSYYMPLPESSGSEDGRTVQDLPDYVSAVTEYGVPFLSMVQTPSLLATQFHPEKSGDVGMGILKRFVDRALG